MKLAGRCSLDDSVFEKKLADAYHCDEMKLSFT